MVGDRTWQLVGDDRGWLYSDKSAFAGDADDVGHWSADLNLQASCPVRPQFFSGSTFQIHLVLDLIHFGVRDMLHVSLTRLPAPILLTKSLDPPPWVLVEFQFKI